MGWWIYYFCYLNNCSLSTRPALSVRSMWSVETINTILQHTQWTWQTTRHHHFKCPVELSCQVASQCSTRNSSVQQKWHLQLHNYTQIWRDLAEIWNKPIFLFTHFEYRIYTNRLLYYTNYSGIHAFKIKISASNITHKISDYTNKMYYYL